MDIMTFTDDEIDALIAKYSPTAKDVDVCIQNMAIYISKLEAENELLSKSLTIFKDACDPCKLDHVALNKLRGKGEE